MYIYVTVNKSQTWERNNSSTDNWSKVDSINEMGLVQAKNERMNRNVKSVIHGAGNVSERGGRLY